MHIYGAILQNPNLISRWNNYVSKGARDSTNFPPNLLWCFIALGSLIWSSPVFILRAVTFKLCTHGLNWTNYVTPKGDCTHQIFSINAFPHVLFQFPATKEIGSASQPDLIWTCLFHRILKHISCKSQFTIQWKKKATEAQTFFSRFSLFRPVFAHFTVLEKRSFSVPERERKPASSQHNAATTVGLVWYNLSTMQPSSHPFTAFYFNGANCYTPPSTLCDSVAWL